LKRELSFSAGCLSELTLLILTFAWSILFDRPAPTDICWSFASLAIGTVAAIPPFAFFIWSLNTKLPLFSYHQDLLESLLRPLFGKWSMPQLLTLSILAGVCEEAFFRGAIQGSVSDHGPKLWALFLASGLFGACHLITWTYAIIAAFIGAYIGLLYIWTGNLLAPMVTHAAYDFAALVYFLRVYRRL
jgi:uncharacterized protein